MTPDIGQRDERTLTQAFDNAVGLFRALARASRSGHYAEGDGIVMFHTGSPVAFFNPTFVTRLPDDIEATVNRVDAYYRERGAPTVIYSRAYMAQAIDALAVSAGFERGPDERGLSLTIRRHHDSPAANDLDIVVVRDAETLDTFHATSARSFDVPSDWLGDLDAERLAGIPGLTLYLGLVNNEPVCTGALFDSGSTAGVHIIGTVAEHRRQGLGQAMTQRVIRDGASAGCLTCALTSSDLSHAMYQRMGFVHVADYAVWERS